MILCIPEDYMSHVGLRLLAASLLDERYGRLVATHAMPLNEVPSIESEVTRIEELLLPEMEEMATNAIMALQLYGVEPNFYGLNPCPGCGTMYITRTARFLYESFQCIKCHEWIPQMREASDKTKHGMGVL